MIAAPPPSPRDHHATRRPHSRAVGSRAVGRPLPGSDTRRWFHRPAAIAIGVCLGPAAIAEAAPRSGGGSSAGRAFSDLAPWLLILGLVVIVGGVVLLRLRRGLQADEGGPRVGFTLHELREMHADGELTDEEFKRARDALVAGVRGASDRASVDHDSASN